MLRPNYYDNAFTVALETRFGLNRLDTGFQCRAVLQVESLSPGSLFNTRGAFSFESCSVGAKMDLSRSLLQAWRADAPCCVDLQDPVCIEWRSLQRGV